MNFNTLACHLEVKIRVDWHDAKLQSSEQLLSSVVYIINRFFRAGVSFSCIGKQNWGIETESKRHTLLAEVSIMMYLLRLTKFALYSDQLRHYCKHMFVFNSQVKQFLPKRIMFAFSVRDYCQTLWKNRKRRTNVSKRLSLWIASFRIAGKGKKQVVWYCLFFYMKEEIYAESPCRQPLELI